MKLNRLIQIHHQNSGDPALTQNLGDGFLIRHNLIYARVRRGALAAGFRFSSDLDPDYQAFAFAQLERILESRCIPYTNNVSVLESLVAKLKDQVSWDEVAEGLKKNFIFHESCHAVARELSRRTNFKGPSSKTFQVLLEESFANSCELLALADVEDSAHRIFYSLNSYTCLFEEKARLKNAIDHCGFDRVLKILILAYLHSNFLYENFDEKQWLRCLKLAQADSLAGPQMKSLKALARLAFTLDLRFRQVTTRFHLKLNGITVPLIELRGPDLFAMGSLTEFLDSASEFFESPNPKRI